jgi:uncharacterized protein YkwD
MTPARAAAAFAELQRTAVLVRAPDAQAHQGDGVTADSDTDAGGTPNVAANNGNNTKPPRAQRTARSIILLGAAVAAAACTTLLAHNALPAAAEATADQDLFALTNQDRSSNGLHALLWHATLSAIGESKPYGGCGFNVNGRSYDMIERNYFAHPILNCNGQLVFNMMSASGIPYRSAGENIGWDSGTGDAAASASYINQQFMNSTEHRDNILNTAYTHLGIGSDYTTGSWSGGGGSINNVWMFSEEFAQLASAPPPPPPPTPRPAPKPTGQAQAQTQPPTPPQPPVNAPTPAATVIPTPTAAPTPVPTPTAIPAPTLGAPVLPLVWSGGGLIADSIESVLEAFLVD